MEKTLAKEIGWQLLILVIAATALQLLVSNIKFYENNENLVAYTAFTFRSLIVIAALNIYFRSKGDISEKHIMNSLKMAIFGTYVSGAISFSFFWEHNDNKIDVLFELIHISILIWATIKIGRKKIKKIFVVGSIVAPLLLLLMTIILLKNL